jgi:hypothetical protein
MAWTTPPRRFTRGKAELFGISKWGAANGTGNYSYEMDSATGDLSLLKLAEKLSLCRLLGRKPQRHLIGKIEILAREAKPGAIGVVWRILFWMIKRRIFVKA